MTKIRPAQVKPSTTNGHVLTTVAGASAWAAASGGLDAEAVRDTIGAALVAGTGMTISVSDAGDTITITVDTSAEAERVRDLMGTALVAGANVTITPNDAGDSITIAASVPAAYTDEQVRDVIAAALVAGSNVTVTPDDAGNTITIAATGGGGGGSALTIKDESTSLDAAVVEVRFEGAGVTAVETTDHVVTVTIPGGGSSGSSSPGRYRLGTLFADEFEGGPSPDWDVATGADDPAGGWSGDGYRLTAGLQTDADPYDQRLLVGIPPSREVTVRMKVWVEPFATGAVPQVGDGTADETTGLIVFYTQGGTVAESAVRWTAAASNVSVEGNRLIWDFSLGGKYLSAAQDLQGGQWMTVEVTILLDADSGLTPGGYVRAKIDGVETDPGNGEFRTSISGDPIDAIGITAPTGFYDATEQGSEPHPWIVLDDIAIRTHVSSGTVLYGPVTPDSGTTEFVLDHVPKPGTLLFYRDDVLVPEMPGFYGYELSGYTVTVGDSADGTETFRATYDGPGGDGHEIRDDGVARQFRPVLDFVGAGVTVTDDSAGDRTVVTIAGGGGYTRTTSVRTGSSLADDASESAVQALGEPATAYRAYRVETDRAARVRLYTTTAKRDADLARPIGTDPVGDHGLVLEYVTTVGVLAADLSPSVDGYIGGTAGDVPVNVTNLSGATGTVTVTLTYVRTE